MRRKGIAETVIMKISGHKTAEVFRRYDIVNECDLRDTAQTMSGIVPGIVGENRGRGGVRE